MQSGNVKKFNDSLLSLLKLFEKTTTNEIKSAQVSRLKTLTLAAKRELGDDVIIAEAWSFFVEYGPIILNPDQNEREKFFLEMDVRSEYIRRSKNTSIKTQEGFVLDMVDIAKEQYKILDPNERKIIYDHIKTMLAASVAYGLAVQKVHQ